MLDKSTSMGTLPWDGDGDPQKPDVSRWRSLHGAVTQVVGARERSLHFGALLSPSKLAISEYSLAACPVEATPEVPVAPMNAASLLAALPPPDAQGPALTGATPTRAALSAAFAHLDAQVDGLPHAVVLVTDGAANCSPDAVDDAARFEVYDEAVVQLVADATAAGVTTFVVGLAVVDVLSPNAKDGQPDATNLFDRLNELALAGGAPQDDPDLRFLAADDQPAIEAALTTIADALSPCVLQFDPFPKYPDLVEIAVAGVDYGVALNLTDCAGLDGWRYVDVAEATIEVCGQACADLRAEGHLEALFVCPGSEEPPRCPRGAQAPS